MFFFNNHISLYIYGSIYKGVVFVKVKIVLCEKGYPIGCKILSKQQYFAAFSSIMPKRYRRDEKI